MVNHSQPQQQTRDLFINDYLDSKNFKQDIKDCNHQTKWTSRQSDSQSDISNFSSIVVLLKRKDEKVNNKDAGIGIMDRAKDVAS